MTKVDKILKLLKGKTYSEILDILTEVKELSQERSLMT